MSGESGSSSSPAGRPRRPAVYQPATMDKLVGGVDPAQRIEAAHATASALVRHGRAATDPAVTERMVRLADEHGLDEIAELWADRPPTSLPGALWRLYALRAGILRDPAGQARAFDAGRRLAPVHEAVAGVAEPPGQDEVVHLADAILAGAFSGDFAVALERAAAFCSVVATGQAVLADALDPDAASRLTGRASALARTATELEAAAGEWRLGCLE